MFPLREICENRLQWVKNTAVLAGAEFSERVQRSAYGREGYPVSKSLKIPCRVGTAKGRQPRFTATPASGAEPLCHLPAFSQELPSSF